MFISLRSEFDLNNQIYYSHGPGMLFAFNTARRRAVAAERRRMKQRQFFSRKGAKTQSAAALRRFFFAPLREKNCRG
jgi:hypothetical protein